MFWSAGELNILGGTFIENEASDDGGVIYASDNSLVTVADGIFRNNEAMNGGVVFADEDAVVLVQGGNFSDNFAENGGGAFFASNGGNMQVSPWEARRRVGGGV